MHPVLFHHTEAETKWPPTYRRHFKMDFLLKKSMVELDAAHASPCPKEVLGEEMQLCAIYMAYH